MKWFKNLSTSNKLAFFSLIVAILALIPILLPTNTNPQKDTLMQSSSGDNVIYSNGNNNVNLIVKRNDAKANLDFSIIKMEKSIDGLEEDWKNLDKLDWFDMETDKKIPFCTENHHPMPTSLYWCEKSKYHFGTIYTYKYTPSPTFDITIFNSGNMPLLVSAINIDIEYGKSFLYTLGDSWSSISVLPEAEYRFNVNDYLREYNFSCTLQDYKFLKKSGINKIFRKNKVCNIITKKINDIPCDSKEYKLWENCSYIQTRNLTEWTIKEPLYLVKEIDNPIYMKENTPYRFKVKLEKQKLPGNIALRFSILTNKGIFYSEYIYLFSLEAGVEAG